jgi:hypothetical protein
MHDCFWKGQNKQTFYELIESFNALISTTKAHWRFNQGNAYGSRVVKSGADKRRDVQVGESLLSLLSPGGERDLFKLVVVEGNCMKFPVDRH